MPYTEQQAGAQPQQQNWMQRALARQHQETMANPRRLGARPMFRGAPAAAPTPASPLVAELTGPRDAPLTRGAAPAASPLSQALMGGTEPTVGSPATMVPQAPPFADVPSPQGVAVREAYQSQPMPPAGAPPRSAGMPMGNAASVSAMDLARQVGEQRHAESDLGRALTGRIADVQRTWQPDFGPGAAMAERERALAGYSAPQGPSWQERRAASQQQMQSMLQQALMGNPDAGEFDPNAPREENVRQLPAGTTLSGTSALGTPVVISRGSAATTDDRTRDEQSQYLSDRRQGRRESRREALQALGQRREARDTSRMAAAQQQREGMLMQQLMGRDPYAAAQMAAVTGRNRGFAEERALRAQEGERAHQLAVQQMNQQAPLIDAQVDSTRAGADRERAGAAEIEGRTALMSDPLNQQRIHLDQEYEALGDRTDPWALNRRKEIDEQRSQLNTFAATQGDSPLSAAFEAPKPLLPGDDGIIPDDQISNALTDAYVNQGLRGEELIAHLEARGVPRDRIEAFVDDNPETPISDWFGRAFSTDWRWGAERRKQDRRNAPMRSLREVVEGG